MCPLISWIIQVTASDFLGDRGIQSVKAKMSSFYFCHAWDGPECLRFREQLAEVRTDEQRAGLGPGRGAARPQQSWSLVFTGAFGSAQTGKLNTVQWVRAFRWCPKQSSRLFLTSTWWCLTSRMEENGLQEKINSRMWNRQTILSLPILEVVIGLILFRLDVHLWVSLYRPGLCFES